LHSYFDFEWCVSARAHQVRRNNNQRRCKVNPDSPGGGSLIHVVTLDCKDAEHAARCIEALTAYGQPDALSFGCLSYEFGLKEGATDTVYLIERWRSWQDLDALLGAKVVPALPMYNQLLKQPFDPGRDTLRIRLSAK
jgi:quinol monooxygenase YgiN